MSEVHAIKDLNTIKLMSILLSKRYGQQIADVWDVGVNVALRISDLLSIRFEDINEDKLVLRECKTGKLAHILLNQRAFEIIKRIKTTHPTHDYVFQSHRSRFVINKQPRPLSRRIVSKAFKEVGQELGIVLGTHSMRKTRGYHLYKQTNDIARVMRMLRHSSEAQTLRYIGITQQDIDADFRHLVL
ncbi:tyrosine-type recombinase/integrase [Glaciecola sp. KUL10]|uniref:tyrosine-type recombinase/integrase n=1 Tax=Glaciecola sp. (strain KUL10) TaxID=2161813 RepID=UPI000D784425|nr:tyrosine-type recombinase/integrase [Glaciecola sp. KUL10]GBL03163.1 Integrase/recombinase, XerC/XerD family protein [Glaciecola sp. KUL10]